MLRSPLKISHKKVRKKMTNTRLTTDEIKSICEWMSNEDLLKHFASYSILKHQANGKPNKYTAVILKALTEEITRRMGEDK